MTGDPTRDQFAAYAGAFDHFNRELFNNELPRCLLNFSRKTKRTMGFFAPDRWESGDGRTHEISLNPDVLRRPLAESMATLVHEMVHLWQREHGKPSRSGYHNREWADAMERVGLMPNHTGEPGGKRTGQRMTHYVIAGGPFDLAFRAMPSEFALPWLSGEAIEARGPAVRAPKNKVRYACPACGSTVWGKPNLAILCNPCGAAYVAEGTDPAADEVVEI